MSPFVSNIDRQELMVCRYFSSENFDIFADIRDETNDFLWSFCSGIIKLLGSIHECLVRTLYMVECWMPNKSSGFAGEVETFDVQIFRIHSPIIFSKYVDSLKYHIYAVESVTISNRTDIHAFEASSASVESQHPSSLKHQQQAEP